MTTSRACALAAFALLITSVLTSADAAADDEAYALPPVVVPVPPPERDAPAPESPRRRDPTGAISVVEAQERGAEAHAASDLAASAPGVLLQDRGGLLQSKTLSIRGASSNGVLVLLDGVPLSGAGGAVDLARIPVAIVQRFEVLRGGGTQHGSGALGGVLNVVTRGPEEGAVVSGALTYGSFNTGMGSVAAMGSLLGGAGLIVLHGQHSNGDFRYTRDVTPLDLDPTLSVARRENNDVSAVGTLLRYRRPLSERITLDTMAELSIDQRGIAGDAQNPTPSRRMQSQRLMGSAALTRTLEAGEVRVRAHGRREHATFEDFLGTPLQTLLSAGVEAEGRLLVNDVHGLCARADVGYDGLQTQGPAAPNWLRASASVQDEWFVGDGDLSLVPSVRLDQSGQFTALSPKLGASVALPSAFHLRANAGQAHRAPSFIELYVVQGALLPNPKLQPERALFADAGLEHRTSFSRIAATGFYSLYENLISYELYLGQSARPYNFSTARVMGLEADGELKLSTWATASASYTLTFSQNLRDDPRYYLNELPYRPRHKAHARLAGGVERLKGRVEVDVQSSQFVNRSATTSVPARAFVNLGATGRVWKRPEVLLSLDLKNVLDTQSWDYDGYPLPGRALYGTVSFSMAALNGDGET